MKKTYAVMFGCGCLTALGLACIFKGIDSTIIMGVSAGIGTCIGYLFARKGEE